MRPARPFDLPPGRTTSPLPTPGGPKPTRWSGCRRRRRQPVRFSMTAKAQLSRGWVSVARCTAWFCVMRASSRCALPSRGRIHARATRPPTCSPFSAPRFSLAWVLRRYPGSLRHRFDGSGCTSPKPWSALGTRCNRKTGCVPVSAGWWRPSRATPAEPCWRTLMKVPGMTMRSPGRESTGICFHRSSDLQIRPERSTSRDELSRASPAHPTPPPRLPD